MNCYWRISTYANVSSGNQSPLLQKVIYVTFVLWEEPLVGAKYFIVRVYRLLVCYFDCIESVYYDNKMKNSYYQIK